MGNISFPLKWKIISTNVLLLMVTVFLIISFAADLFNEDKSATLYEATLNAGKSYRQQVEQTLEENQRTLSLLTEVVDNNFKGGEFQKSFLKSIFNKNERLISFSAWSRERGELIVYLENDVFQSQNQWPKKSWLERDRNTWKESAEGMDLLKKEEVYFLSQVLRKENIVYLARFQMGAIRATNSPHYHHFFRTGEKAIGPANLLATFEKKDFQHEDRVIKGELNKEGFLIYRAQVRPKVQVVTLVNEGLIYQASSFLRDQSLYFSGLILGLTIIFGVFLSRKMTLGLASLHEASLAYAQGQFETQFEVKSRDEIGSLAHTFKKMGKDILSYIEEMKDKARLEKEVEVAKLVQESFIPQEKTTLSPFALYSYYESASECGGDWWGIINRGDWVCLVVADATGHGVPAALLTATASGCLHNIELRLEEENRDYLLPSVILKNINYSISKMGSKIHMTAFALVFNKKTGEGHYCNASHNAPLLISGAREKMGQLDKSSVVPLMDNICPRLGENQESQFVDNPFLLQLSDILVLFSDGILEEENQEEKEYGQRRFLKAILGYINELYENRGLNGLSDYLLSDLKEFTGKTSWSDDLTLLTIGKEEGESKYKILDGDRAMVRDMDNYQVYGDLLKEYPLKSVFLTEQDWEEAVLMKSEGLSFTPLEFSVLGEAQIFDAKNAGAKLDELMSNLDRNGYFDSPIDPLKTAAIELVSNALYHQGFSDKERSLEHQVDEGKSVSVAIAQGEKGIGVLVCDNNGTLEYEGLRKSLVRAFTTREPEWKEGGAGLGLMMLFENTNKVFIERKMGESTKILAIIEKEKRYKKFKGKTTKFSYWEC